VAAFTATKADGAQRLLGLVAAQPGLSGLELAEGSGLSPSTVHYHLRRLQDAGLVAATPQGRSLTIRLTAEGELALRRGAEA
jgi:DNA-binding IclR family transcriptional regulator